MIPYFELTSFNLGPIFGLGPIPIQVWGLCVAIGVLVGLWIGGRKFQFIFGVDKGFSKEVFWNIGFWLVIAGFVGARLGHVFLYEPGFYLGDWVEIFKVWKGGWSSVGGFVGAVVFVVWYLRFLNIKAVKSKGKKINLWKFADAVAFGLPIGWGIGRLGCFFIHDHLGKVTDFFLGITGADGVVRHDLGLYDALLGFGIGVVVFVLSWIFSQRQNFLWGKHKVFDGFFILLVGFLYAVPRFFLDFLRVEDLAGADARYLGLTPAQYVMIGIVVLVGWVWYKKVKVKSA